MDGEHSKNRKGVKSVWLIGEFLASSRTARLGSLYEILFGLLVATLPFWLGGVVVAVVGKQPDLVKASNWIEKLWIGIESTFQNGQLLVFAVSVIAPALWLCAHEPEGATPLPHRRPITAVTFVVVIVCSVLFGLIQADVVVDIKTVNRISLYFTLASIMFMYLALTYHNFRLRPYDLTESQLLEGQDALIQQVQERRGLK